MLPGKNPTNRIAFRHERCSRCLKKPFQINRKIRNMKKCESKTPAISPDTFNCTNNLISEG